MHADEFKLIGSDALEDEVTPIAKLDPDRFVDDRFIAEVLGLSRGYLRQLRVRGGGPKFSRFSAKAIRYRVGDALAWAAERSVSSTSA